MEIDEEVAVDLQPALRVTVHLQEPGAQLRIELWSKLRSTNPLELFNKEIGRRTDVVGIFPDDCSLLSLVEMLCLEQNDEWLVGRRYLSAAAMEPLLEKRLHRDNPRREEVRELTAA